MSTALRSRLVVTGDEFRDNAAAMGALLDQVEALHEHVLAGGGAQYVERHRSRGKMLVRERLEALVDPGTPVLELSPLAGLHTGDPLGGGVVVALAEVAGTQCLVIANDPTVRGGTTSPTTIGKLLRAMDVAEENRLPLLLLVESGGADLPRQADVFVPGGEQFRRLTQLSAQGIPTVCVVFGSSTAGGAYLPGMSDYTVMVEGRARVFLGGPPLVKMAIGEDADEEELGGARMHAEISGLCDYLARDEPEAIRAARGIVAHLHWSRLGPAPVGPADEPRYPAEELLGIASVDVRVPFDVREILARVVDGSRFEEFKTLYGAQLVCGWASIGGYPVGVVANNGILFSPEAQKGAQFIALCNRTDTPILFVQNITGFMVGTRYEQGGIIKDGAKLINAVSNSTVPHLTLMVGASYGAGNYAMAGRAYDPRFVFTWPNHRIAVMGPKQLAGVLSIVRRNAAAAAGRPFDEAADEELRQATENQIEEESTAQYATGRLWDDGIIDPRDTRTVLAVALDGGALGGGTRHGDLRRGAALMLRRLLVANRGEIARRLIRGAHDAGLEAVAVYATDDAASPYVGEADAAVHLPGTSLAETYLSAAALVEAAALAGADSLHPGYGFLSENPALPEACAAVGLTGSGPRPKPCASWATRRGPRSWWPPPACRSCRARWWPRGPTRPDCRPPPMPSGTPSWSRPPPAAAGAACVSSARRASWSMPWPRPNAKRRLRSGRTTSSWSGISRPPATSRCRWSGTATARSCTCWTGSARCSAGIRRWSKRRPRSSCPRRPGGRCGTPPWPWPGRPPTWGWARSSTWSTSPASTSSK